MEQSSLFPNDCLNMPRIPIFRLGSSAEPPLPPKLASYVPYLILEGLQVGIDNLRHDVHLSPKFVEQMRLHISRLVVVHGNVGGLLAAEDTELSSGKFVGGVRPAKEKAKSEPSELKPLLTALQVASLNRAKISKNLTVDVLGRLAILKFLRTELNAQFGQILERCRMTLKNYEGVRHSKGHEYRETVATFQVAKRVILRKAGLELFHTLREIEKESLARMRQSLFGTRSDVEYKLFLNPLVFTEDGRDPYFNAEHYIMLGNFDHDPNRYGNVNRLAAQFVRSLNLPEEDENTVNGWLSVPENAHQLVGQGTPDELTHEGRSQQARLAAWMELLENEGVLEHVIASYEVVPLLAEYSPRIHIQQLKNALISREERDRVEKLIEQGGGRWSVESLRNAVSRTANCSGAARVKVAARFLYDFFRYHRDLQRLEVVNAALDSVNLIANEKMRELSSMNGTLYEFLLEEEQKPAEAAINGHVILKADVRDSTKLTRSLLERGLNPASYFSLNFYEPVNKLLAKYGASKVFLEGDAIILTLLENEGESSISVGRTCVLAREIIAIVRGYNELLQRAGLPSLELGIGISYQNSAPMYLLDGEQRIMISDALNESDRLSSCNKRMRKPVESLSSPFNVYSFQTISDGDAAESPDDFIMKYNLNGIRMSEAAFKRLQQEISLEPCKLKLPQLWGSEDFVLLYGLVPLGNGIFHQIIVRQSRMPQIDPKDFSLQHWTERAYYEVCSNPAIYAALESKANAGK
jgi:hypothetical protein